MTPSNAIWLVAAREVRARLRSKAFLVSTVILLLAVIGSIVITSIAAGSAEKPRVDLVGAPTLSSGQPVSSLPGFRFHETDRATARADVLSSTADSAVLTDGGERAGVVVWTKSDTPEALVTALSAPPKVVVLAPAKTDGLLSYFVALGFGLVFLMSATTFGSAIAQSVVEEKQTRIVELLVAAVSARVLLAGKVLGNSLLAFGQIVLLIAAALGSLAVTGGLSLIPGIGAPVLWFALFFVIGFVLLASLFAAAAALVSRQEDLGTTMTPITMLVVAPYVLVLIFNSNPTALTILSYIPFSAPVAMPLRLFLGSAQWWEVPISLALLVGGTVAVLALGARIYERSLLKLGARVAWRDALAR